MKRVMATALILALALPAAAGWLNDPSSPVEFRAGTEIGFFGVLDHTIRFGVNGTEFDYVREGRQNILFPFERLTAELHLKPRHTIVFLYQPLDIRTAATLENPLIVDTDTFPPGTPMNLRYGFDFYRLSWLYDLWPAPDRELAFGLSGQIRDASIAFASQDGHRQRVYQDLGPVPVLKARLKAPLGRRLWLGAEVDGFYAQGKFITGSTNVESSFKGAILDASLRSGYRLNDALEGFLNLRYLGGGAEGQQVNPENPLADGYTSNWLGAFSLALGFYIR
ncbi:MAG: hypothetical protein R6X12_09305 [bacterium]